MKLAFISDIHGNAVALEHVLNDLKEKNVDKIFVLGDICFRGPEPRRSLDLVRSLNTDVIKGNADEWIVRGIKEGEVPSNAIEIMNREREWATSQLDEESVEYLRQLPSEVNVEYGKVKIHGFHATPSSLFDIVQPNEEDEMMEEKLMANAEADIYIYAHIHKPFIRYINGKCIINTGSVGLPFDGLPRSSYVLIDIQEEAVQTAIIRTDYNLQHVISRFKESNYPNKELMVKVLENASL
jgi:putative phosphoesterase